MLEDDIERESFTVIPIDCLLDYGSKYFLQVHLDNCSSKIAGKQIIDYLGENPFKTDEG